MHQQFILRVIAMNSPMAATPYYGYAEAGRYDLHESNRGIVQHPREPTGSSILEEGAVEEFGRTFHWYKADTNSYMFPNDGEEQNRLDLQHKLATIMMDGRLYHAPLKGPRNVLDLGTGTGIWAIEFAKRHPECRVIGSDISRIQPTNIPENCEFIREDVSDGWTYNQQFDYIHFRFLCAYIPKLRSVLRRIYDHLEPGGWFEAQETTFGGLTMDNAYEGSAVQAILDTTMSAMETVGQNPWVMTILKELLSEAGFVDVQERVIPQPCGSWPKDAKHKRVGNWNALNALAGFGNLTKAITRTGKSEKEAEVMIWRAQKEVKESRLTLYWEFYIVTARKPVS